MPILNNQKPLDTVARNLHPVIDKPQKGLECGQPESTGICYQNDKQPGAGQRARIISVVKRVKNDQQGLPESLYHRSC